jgi:hypothetical protein
LKTDYDVLNLDFQKISDASFKDEERFVQAFCRQVLTRGKGLPIPDAVKDELREYISRKEDKAVFDELFSSLAEWCEVSAKPVVMIIDEVDTATNNQVFLDFLAQLRADYLEREDDPDEKTFQSVILAGVTDVKHLKAKIRPEEAHKEDSPWNIAADFDIDMSLSEEGIKGMLDVYEADHHTGMDTGTIAKRLRKYTSGYPYLVSRLCQLMDGSVGDKIGLRAAWTEQGMDEAIKIILADNKDPLFGSVMGKLVNLPQLKKQLRDILMKGDVIAWLPDDEEQKLLYMYGFIKNENNTVKIANRLFEMRLYQYFLGESRKNEAFRSDALVHKSIL